MNWPTKVLMVKPIGFDVKYAINPYMLDQNGSLNKVDKTLSLKQWEKLKTIFKSLNLDVHLIDGEQNLPDMVFTANQTFPFLKDNKTHMVLSKMNSSHRKPEVAYFEKWAKKNDITTHTLNTPHTYEGMGDILWEYESLKAYGGYGFRTFESIYDELEAVIETKVHRLKLVSEEFYHLDTCLSIVNKNTAFVVKEGFCEKSFGLLKDNFTNLIEIPYLEAKNGFAANLCAVNGTDIIIQKGNGFTVKEALKLGLKVHEVETSEYMKSGGSVFCMKQLFW